MTENKSHHELAKEYENNKDYENMKKHYRKGIMNSCKSSLCDMFSYCIKNDDKEIRFLINFIIDSDNISDQIKGIYAEQLGNYYYNNKSIELSLKNYSMAFDYGIFECCYDIGYCYSDLNNNDKMAEYFTKVIDNSEKFKSWQLGPSFYFLGKYYQKENNTDDMIKNFECSINHGDDDALSELLEHYQKEGDRENIIKYLLIGVNSKNINIIISLGDLYKDEENFDEMKKYYKMAIEINLKKISHIINRLMPLVNNFEIVEFIDEIIKKFHLN